MNLLQRLNARSYRTSCGCQLWLGYTDALGYGRIGVDGKVERTHRAAWKARHGRIPRGKQVLHHCDIPSCIADRCLFLGNPKINSDDKIAKGRLNDRSGELNPNRKLSKSDVKKIRADRRIHRLIALDYGVTRSMISAIKRGDFWRAVQ